jgi:hypothetical protein
MIEKRECAQESLTALYLFQLRYRAFHECLVPGDIYLLHVREIRTPVVLPLVFPQSFGKLTSCLRYSQVLFQHASSIILTGHIVISSSLRGTTLEN